MNKPSQANQQAFESAVEEITSVTSRLFDRLVTHSPSRDREVEAAKARARFLSARQAAR